MPESNRFRAAMFEPMVQQHSNSSPAMLYAPMAPANQFRTAPHLKSGRRSLSRSYDEQQRGDVPGPVSSAKRPKLDTDLDISSVEPRTLRFGPDHRLVSYAASRAPARTHYTHPN
ncbi:hypothetical protein MYAM1_002731 [Malassezia yamatoensis]|uniref:Uncharacterized protein n=1 Tax=Malassezia yamatoensis TaxID=253288 RepID=A0AAJ5Z0G6_9BASI|nr:hypothetical protein MYAM1_002731 [Malassezia yamatoensis]